MKIFKHLILFSVCIATVVLTYSVIQSGYTYVLDVDELFHAHVVYLLANSYQPYTAFYTNYVPMFHWVLFPLFKVFGFTFETIEYARFFMIVLFAGRIGLIYLLIKKIFNQTIALLFIPLLLLDPFTTFAGMQLRPDNLMLLLFTAGLVVLSHALTKKSRFVFFLSGLLFGMSVLTLLKIIPNFAVIFGVLTIYLLLNKRWKDWVFFCFGLMVPIVLFICYEFLQGTSSQMIEQVIFDAKLINDTRVYPMQPGFMYLPDNIYIYGLSGRPIVWIYAWIFPMVAAAGWFRSIGENLSTQKRNDTWLVQLILCIMFVVSWILLLIIKSPFIQYFLSLTWLYGLYGAVAIAHLLQDFSKQSKVLLVMQTILSIVFVVFAYGSYEANMSRSTIGNATRKKEIKTVWSQIPANAYVFPNYLFRPLAYPVPYTSFIGEMPAEILARFQSISSYLDRFRVPCIYADAYTFKFLDSGTIDYIDANYIKSSAFEDLYIRK